MAKSQRGRFDEPGMSIGGRTTRIWIAVAVMPIAISLGVACTRNSSSIEAVGTSVISTPRTEPATMEPAPGTPDEPVCTAFNRMLADLRAELSSFVDSMNQRPVGASAPKQSPERMIATFERNMEAASPEPIRGNWRLLADAREQAIAKGGIDASTDLSADASVQAIIEWIKIHCGVEVTSFDI